MSKICACLLTLGKTGAYYYKTRHHACADCWVCLSICDKYDIQVWQRESQHTFVILSLSTFYGTFPCLCELWYQRTQRLHTYLIFLVKKNTSTLITKLTFTLEHCPSLMGSLMPTCNWAIWNADVKQKTSRTPSLKLCRGASAPPAPPPKKRHSVNHIKYKKLNLYFILSGFTSQVLHTMSVLETTRCVSLPHAANTTTHQLPCPMV